MNKLYVSDLDGTLLKNDGTLSQFSRDNIIKLLKDNVNFTVASARGLNSIRYILKDIPFRLPVIENNGAYITDYTSGEHLIINNINEVICNDIVNRCEKYKLSPFISATSKVGDKLYYKEIINQGMSLLLAAKSREGDPRLMNIDSFNDVISNDKVIGFTIIGKEKDLTPLVEEIISFHKGNINYSYEEDQYYEGWHWLIINDSSATKAKAINMLCRDYLNEDTQLVVFGDNYNDIPMFNLKGTSIAVGNARQELKELATKIIDTNENDSVIKYILLDSDTNIIK